ncbi:NADH-quinone oxidoreductase subunit E [Thalassococcus lentus]|uniref:NADH-quinone oxidoreductase subunit E n=1 Tax=Thalassococcus lentus TaxID=1210524 RepID=A0ABT4XXA0_9RHOB|nr:NADH-quinone oxidoreductase subunit E [Thalassococcus lentus]MDA7426600.1 NADH-quinone oxidoreductase subunit E [Thalassococcus lentus]
MLRRLHHEQPESFAFTPDNLAWAQAQITKYPEGRQASAIIPLLWRAQEQEGWLTRPAIEAVADMLGMAYMRALEVASFYFMFQLQPVGSVAHIQICGTTSCMICGAEDLIAVCREKIADKAHALSADGKFSWEEVECLGACTNAPMAQIGKDYYEDLTTDKLRDLLDALARGDVPQVGPQNGRFASEPASGITSLTEFVNGSIKLNASAQLASDIGDTVKRIDGTEVALKANWSDMTKGGAAGDGAANSASAPKSKAKTKAKAAPKAKAEAAPKATKAAAKPAKETAKKVVAKKPAPKAAKAEPAAPVEGGTKPAALKKARGGQADDLKRIKGIGPKLEQLCNRLGFYHFDQIAEWSADEVAWVDANLEGFKGRVSRDSWVDQAKVLASGGETEFSTRVKKGNVYDK